MMFEVWYVLLLCDGCCMFDEVWDVVCVEVGDVGVSIFQYEFVQFVLVLYVNDLLQIQVLFDVGEVFECFEWQCKVCFKQNWLNLMSLCLLLFYFDVWFDCQVGLVWVLFSVLLVLLWLVLVGLVVVLGVQYWNELIENLLDCVLLVSNFVLLWFVYLVVKVIYEWVYGLVVKVCGGMVCEIGFFFIIFMLVFYVDVILFYGFVFKWVCVQVVVVGILVELVLGVVVFYVWLVVEFGLVMVVVYNVILIVGVLMLVVNGNLLMCYDGYFIVIDLLELFNFVQ